MTRDEWLSFRIENVECADSSEEPEAPDFPEKAIYCIEHGEDESLARTHLTYR